MTTSTTIGLRVRRNLGIHITPQAASPEALGRLRGKCAHAGHSTGTRLGGARASTSGELVEDRIVRNELWLTLVEKRRICLLAAAGARHLQKRHLDMLDSWEDSIQRRLAGAWAIRHASGV